MSETLSNRPSLEPSPEDRVIERERYREVSAAVGRLSEQERVVLALLYGLRLNPHAINATARALGISADQVKRLERDALDKIREELEDQMRGTE